MADQKYISVYNTLDPSFMVAYQGWISKICFGVTPGNTDHYSFTMNRTNGHFNFALNSKVGNSSQSAQTEGDAKKLAEEFISKIQEKVKNEKNRNKNFPKNFPTLFDPSYLKLDSAAPIYNEAETEIIGWHVFYTIEIATITGGDSTQKIVLDDDSITLQISGKTVMSLDYHHTPISAKKEFVFAGTDTNNLVYKSINHNVLAPHYIVQNTYVPACSESVTIQSRPMTYGLNRKSSKDKALSKSMLTLTKMGDPKNGIPGSAKIVIAMDYRIVTFGVGSVKNAAVFDKNEFRKMYKRGDAPGPEHKAPLKLKVLPSEDLPAILLTTTEHSDSKKIDPVTGNPVFWKYYNVTIEYDYTLSALTSYSLWEGINWIKECPFSRGLVYILPFENESYRLHSRDSIPRREIRKSLPIGYKDTFTKEEIKELKHITKINLKTERIAKYDSKIISYTILNLIFQNISYYKDANIYVGDFFVGLYKKYLDADIDLSHLLRSINSNIFPKKPPVVPSGENWVQLKDYDDYKSLFVIPFSKFAVDAIEEFHARNLVNNSPEYGAKGSNTALTDTRNFKMVVLNPDVFDRSPLGSSFRFGQLTGTEVLAHEAGHNAAFVHRHNSPTYRYTQEGLQSNGHGLVYPTLEDNTFNIINDAYNRLTMEVL